MGGWRSGVSSLWHTMPRLRANRSVTEDGLLSLVPGVRPVRRGVLQRGACLLESPQMHKAEGFGDYRAFWEMLLNDDDEELSARVAGLSGAA